VPAIERAFADALPARLCIDLDVARSNVGSQDAAHLASAAEVEVRDFASPDEAYRRVDGLILWNDLIHTAPAR
jgi:predicted nucleic acid-binding protein